MEEALDIRPARPEDIGIVLDLLEEAAGWLTAAAGRTALRLDCMTENRQLRAYYESLGFRYRGEKCGTTWRSSLYERLVSPNPDA